MSDIRTDATPIQETPQLTQSPILEAARLYRDMGIAVTPLKEGTNIPYLKDWQLLPMPTDEELVSWFAESENNIGIRTGHASNLFVLDVDMKHGKNGKASLAALEAQHGELPLTQKAYTPTGGIHLFFRPPEGVYIKNSVDSLGEGLDIRGQGGQVAAAPSIRPDGTYEWDDELTVEAILEAPEWMVELVKIRPPTKKRDYQGPHLEKKAECDKANSALGALSVGDMEYDDWLRVGMALHDGLGDDGFKLFDDWSGDDKRYPGTDELWFKKWHSFHAGGGRTLGTLYDLAKRAGWTMPRNTPPDIGESPKEPPKLTPVPDPTPVVNIPSFSTRPEFRVFNEWVSGQDYRFEGTPMRKYAPGVWLFDMRQTKDHTTAVDTRICDPIYVRAVTRSHTMSDSYGRLLEFKRPDGVSVRWVMPMSMLSGDGVSLRAELFDKGFLVEPKAARRTAFMEYLQARNNKIPTVTSVRHSGWVGDDAKIFALPDASYGPGANEVVYETSRLGANDFAQRGDVERWRSGVAAKAVGNPLLMLAISCAFAGPLLKICHMKGGGFHFYNGSSTGKTTLLEAACSVWGGPSYIRTWRATANGLEGSALLFNDNLIALDEISQATGEVVGDVAYFITNGEGKQRANIYGAVRPVARWTCFALSTGERSLGAHMKEGQKRSKVGQEIRIIDIQSDRECGVFDTLPEDMNGARFADVLRCETHLNHGVAGREFLSRLTADDIDMDAVLLKKKHGEAAFRDVEGGQEERAAMRFALVGMAGELATHYGITGWRKGDAMGAAVRMFKEWKGEDRKSGDQESHHVIAILARFLEKHGSSRFAFHAVTEREQVVRDQAGWWKADENGDKTYWLSKSGMDEVLKEGHYDSKPAIKALREAGVVVPGSDGRNQQRKRTPDGLKWVYVIDSTDLQ